MQRAGCAPAPAVNREPKAEGGALSMTERNAGRNGNNRSSRLCGVSARTVSLTRHSPADKSVIRADADGVEVPIDSGAWGGQKKINLRNRGRRIPPKRKTQTPLTFLMLTLQMYYKILIYLL